MLFLSILGGIGRGPLIYWPRLEQERYWLEEVPREIQAQFYMDKPI